MMGESGFPSQTPTDQAGVERTEVVVARRSQVDGQMAPWSARSDAAVKWVGWHLVEIAVVGGSAWLAIAMHPWWSAVTVLAAAGWAAHERTSHRRRTAVTGEGKPAQPADPEIGEQAREAPGGDAGWTA